jgi:hypothetical protein
MDDVLKLFSEMIVDLQGFNDSHFGIFHQDEREDLIHMWFHEANRNPNKFISLLSPAQKRLVVNWATQRASYNTVRLIETLEKFTEFLKKLNSPVYPPPRPISPPPKGARRAKSSATGLKGWKKIIYKSKTV